MYRYKYYDKKTLLKMVCQKLFFFKKHPCYKNIITGLFFS